MSKNILIFSDGTGQAGGLLPDELRSNVYKLFRATRCGPDSSIDPTKQLTFYDPGLGSKASGEFIRISWMRRLYNLVSQLTGLGISRNIIDCYAAIIQMWKPGDRIYLFGFSRGAYTVRCLGGVLALCGVPQTKDGVPIKLDSKSVHAIADEAVKKVYQHGSSKKQKRFRKQREVLAANFREKYASNNAEGRSNAVPYFVGVWDTGAALGASWERLFLAGLIVIPVTIGIIAGASLLFSAFFRTWLPELLLPWMPGLSFPLLGTYNFWLVTLLALGALAIGIAYLVTHVKFATGTGDPIYKTLHMTLWGLQFYDRTLDDRVSFARHALSIDEDRKDFDRVPWVNAEGIHPRKAGEMNWFEQIWFAGIHSDIGGGYSENESRLSDISLAWMANEAMRAPFPILVDKSYLKLFPSAAGKQHDERRGSLIPWTRGIRKVPDGAFLHPTVFERLALDKVQVYDAWERYDPEPLRGRTGFKRYVEIPAPSDSQKT